MTNESIKGAKADDGRRWISLHHGRYVQYRNNPNTMTKATKATIKKHGAPRCVELYNEYIESGPAARLPLADRYSYPEAIICAGEEIVTGSRSD